MKHAAVAAGVSQTSLRRYFSHRGRDKVQNALPGGRRPRKSRAIPGMTHRPRALRDRRRISRDNLCLHDRWKTSSMRVGLWSIWS
jgi:hypothetical protein